MASVEMYRLNPNKSKLSNTLPFVVSKSSSSSYILTEIPLPESLASPV